MYLRNTRNEVKDLIERVNELDNENKMKYIIYIFNLWDNDQINSLNEINPYLLLMAHTIIRHVIEIDKNTSNGIQSHID